MFDVFIFQACSTERPARRIGALAVLALLAGFAPSPGGAQPAPRRYSVTETLFLVTPGQIMKIGRDGPRAIIEQTLPQTVDSPAGVHVRAYYDLTAQQSFTLDLVDPATPRGRSHFTGEWGDSFAMSADLLTLPAKGG